MNKHILLGTSVYKKYKRQDLCVEGLCKLKLKNQNVDVCLIQQTDENVMYKDITIYKELTRNSSNVFDTKKNIPFVNDILNVLCDKSTDIFVFCNSDTIPTQRLIDYINSTNVEAFGISRIDINEIESLNHPAHIIRMEPAGFDCWVISKKWWMLHKHLFLDFVIGRPYFDVMYTLVMLLNSSNLYVSDKHLLFHCLHAREWENKDESYFFNKNQKETHYNHLEPLWGNLANNTFLKRNDWGSFLQINPDEQNIIKHFRDQFKYETLRVNPTR